MKVYKKIICDMFWLNQEIFSNCNFDVKDYTIIHSLFLFRTFKMVVRDSEFPELRIVSLTLCRITRKFVSTIPNLLGKLLWFWYSMYWHVNCCLIQIEILLRDKVDKANVRTGLSHCAALRQFKTNMIPGTNFNNIVFDTICHRCWRFLKHNFYFSSTRIWQNLLILPEMRKIFPVSYQNFYLKFFAGPPPEKFANQGPVSRKAR